MSKGATFVYMTIELSTDEKKPIVIMRRLRNTKTHELGKWHHEVVPKEIAVMIVNLINHADEFVKKVE